MQFGNPLSQYSPAAAGLAFTGATAGVSYNSGGINIPLTARTLVISWFGNPGPVYVQGAVSGQYYASQIIPYLNNGAIMVVPVNGAIDPVIIITALANTTTGPVLVYADSSSYTESLFYNGPITRSTASAVGTTALVTGPCRILNVECEANPAAVASARAQVGGQIILTADSKAASVDPAIAIVSFAQPYIVPYGSTLSGVIVSGGIVTVNTAYP